MKRTIIKTKQLILMLALLTGSLVTTASSHREAPLISNDPLCDNTDLYAFRSPDDPNTVTIIANYIPFQLPEGEPVGMLPRFSSRSFRQSCYFEPPCR